MVKHIVLFRLREDMDAHEKTVVMEHFKHDIEALPGLIPSIRRIEVGMNVNVNEAYDLALYSEFDTLEDVVGYGSNPHHVAVASALKPYVAHRSCCDYEA